MVAFDILRQSAQPNLTAAGLVVYGLETATYAWLPGRPRGEITYPGRLPEIHSFLISSCPVKVQC